MNRQRHVIDRARAHREGKRYGAFFEGHRAYGQGLRLDECPYASRDQARAWRNGWRYARAQEAEP